MKSITILATLILSSCSNYGQLKIITELPNKIGENSGIAYYGNDRAWFIEDHGNEDVLYQVSFNGELTKEFKVKNATNSDWEDLTTDDRGNIYIADLGNNQNKRDDLVIYKLPNPENEPGDHIDAEKIHINYPEQKKFPPKKKDLIYDSEAIFYNNNYIYIITKNRSNPFSGKALIYKVPAEKGTYDAELIGNFTPCKTAASCKVTAAAISPSGKKVVLLGYGYLWIFTDFKSENFTTGTLETIDLGTSTQLESVCFKDEKTLLISDEERGKTGQNLYSFSLK
ncbi:hypothetical protein KO500_03715 [Cellulophaga baltica]|uniref:hypothetical protein n=1 Tax=Cellulophaga TaxID=104264 RepID=UPI001C068F8C|nr:MULTISPECIES: hypothetical protein [Cellulophaga]MBU2995521.1 hypothetical protein [Cellulophaga baltica]MDO6766915.1 hypothetical protein [Cellulophaga sp. 1_MG-2023]